MASELTHDVRIGARTASCFLEVAAVLVEATFRQGAHRSPHRRRNMVARLTKFLCNAFVRAHLRIGGGRVTRLEVVEGET